MILPNRVLVPGKGAMKQGVVVNVGQEFLDVNVDNVVSDYWTVDVRRVTETDSESVIEGQLFVLKDQRGTHRIDVVKVSYVGPVQEIPLVVGQGGNRFLGKFCFFYRYYMVVDGHDELMAYETESEASESRARLLYAKEGEAADERTE